MRRCLLHIGMHKTGSTSIQHSLMGFENDSYVYARIGNSANHSLPLHGIFTENPERHFMNVARGRSGAVLRDFVEHAAEDLRHSIGRLQGRTLIISGEAISTFSPTAAEKLARFLEPHFDEIAVAGYIRPPGGFITSSFQAKVRSAGLSRFELAANYRPYRMTFEKFDHLFGRAKVHLWAFEPKAFPQGCVVRDFCGRLGIALSEDRIVRKNEATPKEIVQLIYAYNKVYRSRASAALHRPRAKRLQVLLDGIGHSKFRLSPALVDPFLDGKRKDIAWMEARLGQRLREPAGDHRPGDIRSEADLLDIEPEAVDQLRLRLGDACPAHVRGRTAAEVALLIHTLLKIWDEEIPLESSATEETN